MWALVRQSWRLLTVLTLMASALCTSQSLAPQEVSAPEVAMVAAGGDAPAAVDLVDDQPAPPPVIKAETFLFIDNFVERSEVTSSRHPRPRGERAPPRSSASA